MKERETNMVEKSAQKLDSKRRRQKWEAKNSRKNYVRP